jgi:hypothetical protein
LRDAPPQLPHRFTVLGKRGAVFFANGEPRTAIFGDYGHHIKRWGFVIVVEAATGVFVVHGGLSFVFARP